MLQNRPQHLNQLFQTLQLQLQLQLRSQQRHKRHRLQTQILIQLLPHSRLQCQLLSHRRPQEFLQHLVLRRQSLPRRHHKTQHQLRPAANKVASA